jgi:hypothetical protein
MDINYTVNSSNAEEISHVWATNRVQTDSAEPFRGYDLNDASPQHADDAARDEFDQDELSAKLADLAYLWVPEVFSRGRIDNRGEKLHLANIEGDPPKKRGSCVIDLKGERAGCWVDFGTGGKGGPLSTLAEATGLHGRELFERAAEICGSAKPKSNGHDPNRSYDTKVREHEETAREVAFIRRYCVPAAGTLVEKYLASRGLELPDCADIQYHPDLTDYDAKRSRPGLVAIMRDPATGAETGGVQRIYLADDGGGKANMPEPKKMRGRAGVAMLMPIREDGVLGVAEGIETALAAARIFGIPVWAALSAGGLRKFAFPAALKELTIFADRGEGGEKAAWALHRKAIDAGIAAFVVYPKSDDDFAKDLPLGHTVSDYRPEQPLPHDPRTGRSDRQPGRGLPVVPVGGGALPHAIDAAEAILIDADKAIFQRGDFVVRPAPVMVTISDNRKTSAIRLVPVKTQHMIERFTRYVDFQKFDARDKKWHSIDCPPNVAAAYLERVGDWELPVLTGIANAPTLRPDGSILDQPGYDAATGILYDPRGVDFPPIPPKLTIDDARTAVAELKALICEFPFAPDSSTAADIGAPSASRSVALSAMLTAAIRRSIPAAPLHAFTAPAMGTGKSKLVDLASMIAVGHEAPVLAQGKTEEEMEKRLGAALIAGDALISFDNCEQPLGGELLCQALTQPTLSIRILGKSVNVTVWNNAAFYATGNNLIVAGDMTRRALVATLDAKCERPETRAFTTEDPIAVVRRSRAKFVVAVLTILRAYHCAGHPTQSSMPLGSFEMWSARIRDALIWIGEPDPCATMERARADDPRVKELAAVLQQWGDVIGSTPVTVKEIIDKATDYYKPSRTHDLNEGHFFYPDFREALLVIAGEGGTINSRRLGNWLGRKKMQVIEGRRLVPATMQRGENRWQVVPVTPENG